MNRRNWMALTALSATRVWGANDRIRAGVIGSGGRGRLLTGEFKEIGAEVAAVCDVYQPNLQAGLEAASTGAKSFTDYRKLLDEKSLDVVIIATPDHWHAPMAIDAVNAGKDVYLEKPMAHEVEEGFRLIDAVRRTKRVLQVGTQRRSFDLFQEAKQVKDTAEIGPIALVNGWWYNRQNSLRQAELKGELNWNQWLGSAPKRPLDPNRFFNWYYFWDYSGGLMVGQAAHIVDAINWFMGSTYPVAVSCAGAEGTLGAEVPETTSMLIEYPEKFLAVFTVGYKAMVYNSLHDQNVQYNGTKARFDVGRESYALYPESPRTPELKPSIKVERPGSFPAATRQHIRNFLEAVKDRKDPSAPVEAGQYTSVALAMAMKALREGRRVRWDRQARRMVS